MFKEKLLLLREIYRRASFSAAYSQNQPLLLIYQMGKVGSTSLYKTLLNSDIPYRVIHTHLLSAGGIKEAYDFHRNKGWQDPLALSSLKTNRVISDKLLQTPPADLKIITLVREPVSRAISNYFENNIRADNNIHANDIDISVDKICRELDKIFRHRITRESTEERWFSNELKTVFGFDVFSHSFDKDAGFAVSSEPGYKLIVSTMESLDTFMRDYLPDILSIEYPLKIQRSNIGADKQTASLYKRVASEFRLDRDLCEKMFSGRYVRHFYTDQMIDSFISRWSR